MKFSETHNNSLSFIKIVEIALLASQAGNVALAQRLLMVLEGESSAWFCKVLKNHFSIKRALFRKKQEFHGISQN